MPAQLPPLTRADLPATFTPETIQRLPLATLRRLADPRNGILNPNEQQAFDSAMNYVMRGTAERVSRSVNRSDWAAIRRDAARSSQQPRRPRSRADEQLQRMARRIGEQVDVAEALAPGVDWSFAQPVGVGGAPTSPAQPSLVEPSGDASTDDAPDQDHGTVSDLEGRLTDQIELIEVMTEIAEVGERTLALEQQRDLQTTRGVFFGFVVSVAVLVAGWAPLVAAKDWTERWWTIGLTLGTCALAGAVYGMVRMWETRRKRENLDNAS